MRRGEECASDGDMKYDGLVEEEKINCVVATNPY